MHTEEYRLPALEALGPVVDVEIRVSQHLVARLMSQKQPVPPPVRAHVVIDTGATFCAFTPRVFQALGIEPYDVVPICTTSTAHEERNQYWIDLSLEHSQGHRRFNDLQAIESNFTATGLDGILGRNFLRRVIFTYDGRMNRYVLEF